jgi:UTP--glucose-1-phosphate uridylyltransferase
MTQRYPHLDRFEAKMKAAGLDDMVVATFKDYYRDVVDGATGVIPDDAIRPPTDQEVLAAAALEEYREVGRRALPQAGRITLNGGLGTSMGLQGPKSLLPVRERLTFLEIIMRQAECDGIRQVFMNSFNTHDATLEALAGIPHKIPPLTFVQNKFPKILKNGHAPATWRAAPELEWNPPGHGDIYTAIRTSGTLDRLHADGCRYALICNSDNLGATLDPALLGFMAANDIPFMMEVARRTPADAKGGHLAVRVEGGLILRESAQFPPGSDGGDVERYAYFNTNNLWVDLQHLKALIEARGTIKLPLIVNPKTLDPRDPASPQVLQLESAMGAAIGLFEGARAVLVPRTRFFPVKKCNDLLVVRSDCFVINDRYRLIPNPAVNAGGPLVRLDPQIYGPIDQFENRFPDGVPSLRDCEQLTVNGDFRFEHPVTIKGRVTLTNSDEHQKVIAAGSVITDDPAR